MKDDSRPARFIILRSSFIVHPSSFLLLTEPAFPRGEGYYYNLVNLVALLVLYFCWVRTSAWIDEDARLLHIPAVPWNPLMLGCGLAGMFVVWLLPWFWISFAVLLVLYLAPSLAYASVRNHHVAEEERVLNEHHFRRLAERYLRIKSAERKTKKNEGPAIQFIGRSVGQAEDDPARVERAVHSKGYKTAAALVHQALQEQALGLSELRRKLPTYAVTPLETVLMEQVNQGKLHRHPRPGKRGGDRFGTRPADPKDYLRAELAVLFLNLEKLGFTQEQLREGALELLHEEEWASTISQARESASGQSPGEAQAAPAASEQKPEDAGNSPENPNP